MYSRKIHQSILQPNPRFRNSVKVTTRKSLSTFSFVLEKFSSCNTLRIMETLRNRIRENLKNDKFFSVVTYKLLSIPRNMKEQSSKILHVWAQQCECVLAQRLRRSQQMFFLYSKLWEERALIEFLRKMQQQVTKCSKELLIGAVGISVYDWNTNRISDETIMQHIHDLDYFYKLKEKTVVSTPNRKSDTTVDKKDSQSYEDWSLFIQENDLLVWRRPHPAGSFEYKVYGSYDDVTAQDFLNVQVDINFRKKWDETAIQLEVIEKDSHAGSNSDLVYWEMLWPKLFSNRDYVFQRRFVVDHKSKIILLINRSTEHPNYPERSETFRIKDYNSLMVIKPHTDFKNNGLEFGLTYYDNPGVNIPSTITTWVAMKAMPEFLNNLRNAAKSYKTYCDEGNECIYNMSNDRGHNPSEINIVSKRYPFSGTDIDVMTSPILRHSEKQHKSNYQEFLQSSCYIS